MTSERHTAVAQWLEGFLQPTLPVETSPVNPYHLRRSAWSQRDDNVFTVWDVLLDNPEAKLRIQACLDHYRKTCTDFADPILLLTLDGIYIHLGYGDRVPGRPRFEDLKRLHERQRHAANQH